MSWSRYLSIWGIIDADVDVFRLHMLYTLYVWLHVYDVYVRLQIYALCGIAADCSSNEYCYKSVALFWLYAMMVTCHRNTTICITILRRTTNRILLRKLILILLIWLRVQYLKVHLVHDCIWYFTWDSLEHD